MATIAIFMLLVTTQLFAARPWEPVDDAISGIPTDQNVTVDHKEFGIGHLQIAFRDPAIKMEQVSANNREWTLVTIDGESRLWEVGKPALPMIPRAIRLPNRGNVELKVTPGDFVEYYNVDIMPQQSTNLVKKGNTLVPEEFSFDETQYKTDAWFPEHLAWLSTPALIRDARTSVLGVLPVQYNPVRKILRVYKSIQIESVPTGGMGINELLTTRSHAVPSFAAIYSDIIGAEDLQNESQRALPGQILMIARTNLVATLQPWANWKTASGRPCQIIVPNGTGSATSDLQPIINTAYNTWDPPLETVLLIGDGGTSGDYYLPSYTLSTWNTASDHGFAMIAGNDTIADAWVGRVSCTTAQELQTQINKSMNYERTPYMGSTGSDTTWYTYGWGYAGTNHDVYSNRPNVRYCLSMMNARGITNTVYDEYNSTGTPFSATLIASRLTPGAIFWANRESWVGEMSTSDFTNINNYNKPFISLNVTCGSGDWYGATNGLQEGITKLGTPTQPRGAITGFATSTTGTNPGHNNVISAGTFYGFGVKNLRQPGPMYYEGKYQMWRNYPASDEPNRSNFIFWNNAMGDLSVNIWTGVPRAITANIPQTLAIGQNRLSFQVLQGTTPLEGALVTAWKKNVSGVYETYDRYMTTSNGNVLLTLSNVTSGSMFVTITGNKVGLNVIPIIDTIAITQASTDLCFASTTIADDNNSGRIGNLDGIANPGETLDLTVSLINRGTTSATNVRGTLTSTDSRVVVTNPLQSWVAIASNSTIASNAPYRLQLLSGLKDCDTIPMQLDIVTDQGSRTVTVPLIVRSLDLSYISSTTSSTWIPGTSVQLTVTVDNDSGLAITTPTTAILTSLLSGVSVTSATSQYATLPIEVNVNNASSPWTIFANSQVLPGTQVPFMAVFSNGSVYDTITFNVTVGSKRATDPTGPDAYGYYIYDDADLNYANAPTYSWVEIIPALGGPGTRLGMNDINEYTDSSVVVNLPFGVKYYGTDFSNVTICTNDWLAFGSQANFNFSRNWRLPTFEGPRNMVAVNWCDMTNSGTNEGVYTYSDVTNHRFIITWKTTTLWTPTANECQIIIYDSHYYQTPTGDAPMLLQYKTFNPTVYSGGETGVSYCTIGICDGTYTRGLEYCWWNTYSSGSSSIPTGTGSNHAMLITTAPIDSAFHFLSPVSGDSLAIGKSTLLQWRGRLGTSNVNIDLNRSYPSGSWERILINTPNTGAINWTITAPTSNTARFRVTSPSGAEGDTMKGNAIIGSPRLIMSSPNGGETWSGVTPLNINWASSMVTGTVTVQLNRSYPSGVWETLFSGISNTGTVGWIPTSPSSSTARIRVMSDLIPTVGDTSNANFTVSGPATISLSTNPIVQYVAPSDTTRVTYTLSNTGDAAFSGTLTSSSYLGTFGYTTSAQTGGPTYSWVDASTGTDGPIGDDAISGPFTLPFSFPFYGTTYNQVWMCTNGWITFNSTTATDYNNTAFPIAGSYSNIMSIIAPYFDDLYVNGTATTKILMDPTNNRAIFAWNGVRVGSAAGTIYATFEVILYNDGRIFFEYGTITSLTRNSQTIGVQNADRSQYIQVNYNAAFPSSNYAIRFQNAAQWAIPSTTSFTIPSRSNQAFSMLFDGRNRVTGDSSVGTLTFTGNASNSPYNVPMTMRVSPLPSMTVKRGTVTIADNTGTTAFDTTRVMQNSDVVFTISNAGPGVLNLTGTPIVATTGDFTVTSQPTTPVAVNGSTTFTVRFSPQSAGAKTGTISIANNDATKNPYNFALTGFGRNPNMVIRRGTTDIASGSGTVTFDTCNVGRSVDQVLTIANTGNFALNLTGTPIVTTTGSFSVVTQPATTIAVGGTTTFTVRFTPGLTGINSGTLSILNTDTLHSPYQINLTGFANGPQISVRDGALNIARNDTALFDTTSLSHSVDLPLSLFNGGNQTLTMTGNPLVSTTGNFSLFTRPAINIAAAGSSTFILRFTPTTIGMNYGTATILSNDSLRSPFTFTLAGYVAAPVMAVRLGATAIPSGSSTVVYDTTTFLRNVDLTFSIFNTGNRTLNLTGTPLVTVPTGYRITSLPTTSIVAGGSTTMTIRFTPPALGDISGTVTIANSDSTHNPYTFNVTGYVRAPSIEVYSGTTEVPTSTGRVVFDTTQIWRPIDVTLSIRNTGNMPLNLTGTPAVHTTGNFSVVTQPTSPISANGSANFVVRFTPTEMGAATGSVTIASNDTLNPTYTFNLSAYVATPVVEVLYGSQTIVNHLSTVSFDTTLLGETIELPIYIRNIGNHHLDLSGSPIVTTTGNFTISLQPANTVNPGELTEFYVHFTPTVAGISSGTISFNCSDSLNSPFEFGVTCIALSPQISLSIGGVPIPSESTVAVDSTALGHSVDEIFTISNTGDFELNLTGSPAVTVTGDFAIASYPSASILQPGESTTFTIRFTPSVYGVSYGTVVIPSSDLLNTPFTFQVMGNTSAPVIGLRRGLIAIANGGSVPTDTTFVGLYRDISYKIYNYGESPLQLTGSPRVTATGSYSVQTQPDSVIAGGSLSIFVIRFTPTSAGLSSGTISIENNDLLRNPFTFVVSGFGIEPFSSPSNLQIVLDNRQSVLSWSAAAGTFDGYEVYRGTTGYFAIDTVSKSNLVATIGNESTSWTDTSSLPAKYYRITAYHHISINSSSASTSSVHAEGENRGSTDLSISPVTAVSRSVPKVIPTTQRKTTVSPSVRQIRRGHGRIVSDANRGSVAPTLSILPINVNASVTVDEKGNVDRSIRRNDGITVKGTGRVIVEIIDLGTASHSSTGLPRAESQRNNFQK